MGVFVANAMDDGYIQLLLADEGWGVNWFVLGLRNLFFC